MKNLRMIAACSLALTFGQMAQASPQEDAAFVADKIVTGDVEAMLTETGVNIFAGKIAGLLADRSVKVNDDAAYRALLAAHFAAETEMDLRGAATEMLLEFSPEELVIIAKAVREDPNAVVQDTDASIALEELPNVIAALPEDDTAKASLMMLSVFMGLVPKVMADANSIEVALTAPYMADILETDGVFQFPNRIVRKDLIAEIRAANP